MAKSKSKKKPEDAKPKEHARTRTFWGLVYFTLTLLLVIGVTLIIRQNILPDTEYAPPDRLSLLAPALTPMQPAGSPEFFPEPVEEPLMESPPVRIFFDGHQLQADIRAVGVAEDNSIDTVPSATIAGWFDQGPKPGDPGNAIISGHVTWKGKKGTFSILHDMEVGEQVTILFQNGAVRYFEAVSKNQYPIDDFPSFVTDLDGDTRMTLITCLGDYDRSIGTSRTRVVVECVEKRELRQDAASSTPESGGEAAQGAVLAPPDTVMMESD